MSRSYANVLTAIWRDETFRALPAGAQRTYLMLVTQPNISAAGTLPLTMVRWASCAADTSTESLHADLAALRAGRFVVVDEATEELLVRSFVRHDNGYRNPKRRPAILDAAHETVSDALRGALAAEFGRLGLPADGLGGTPPEPEPDARPSMAQDAVQPTVDDPVDNHGDNAKGQVDSLSIANRMPTDSHADSKRDEGCGYGSTSESPTLNPQSSSRAPTPRTALSRPARLVVEHLGCDDDDARWIVGEVQRRHRPRSLAGYVRQMATAGDLAPLLAERHGPPDPDAPPKIDASCGRCDANRQIEVDGTVRRCPRCHPLRAGSAA